MSTSPKGKAVAKTAVKPPKSGNKNVNYLSEKPLKTPIANVQFCHLDSPRVDEEYDKEQWEITLLFNEEVKEHVAFMQSIDKMYRKFCDDNNLTVDDDYTVFKQAKDKEKEPIDGCSCLTFSSGTRYDKKTDALIPFNRIVDKTGKECDAPWRGSEVRVSFTPSGWIKSKKDYGIKLYLDGVLVITAANGGSRASLADTFAEDIEDPLMAGDSDTSHGGDDDDVPAGTPI